MEKEIEIEVQGIAEILKRDFLIVPENQREYAWSKDIEVKKFLEDINNAIRSNQPSYFLGTVVLIKGKDALSIADGQQRIATTAMTIAAIRDWFSKNGMSKDSNSIESEFLIAYHRPKKEDKGRLTLNIDDNDYFFNSVLLKKHSRRPVEPKGRSNRLIMEAFKKINDHIAHVAELNGKQAGDALNDIVEYLKDKTQVVKLVVSNEQMAYMLFETLNDRGLKTSQADLVKNHLLKQSAERSGEVQKLWSAMKFAIESVTDFYEDVTVDFLRASCSIIYGHTTKRDVFEKIQENANNVTSTLSLSTLLEEFSREYSAIINPEHIKWNQYPYSIRESIKALNELGVTQIRPLMISVSRSFNQQNAAKAFQKLVSWSVRFIILGIRGGRLDIGYARLANEIYNKKIKNVDDLTLSADDILIRDRDFREAFEIASIGTTKLARYLLRSLESQARNEPQPEFIPNDNTFITLEHIMPKSPEKHWEHVNIEDHATFLNRLGNLSLMQVDKNSKIGSLSFKDKKEEFKKSSFLLTSQLSELKVWDVETIRERQKKLAELAVATWPL